MADDTTTTEPAATGTEPAIGLITDGAYALIVARYPSMADAQAA